MYYQLTLLPRGENRMNESGPTSERIGTPTFTVTYHDRRAGKTETMTFTATDVVQAYESVRQLLYLEKSMREDKDFEILRAIRK